MDFALRERIFGVASLFAAVVIVPDLTPSQMVLDIEFVPIEIPWEPPLETYELPVREVTWEPEEHDLIRPIRALELHPNRDELHCLALNTYHEARGSTLEDQIGTALVVMNRVEAERYPDSICEVVYQYRQFSWTHDHITDYPHERNAWIQSQIVALAVGNGQVWDKTNGATHYHTTTISPYWTSSVNRQVIGAHVYMTTR